MIQSIGLTTVTSIVMNISATKLVCIVNFEVLCLRKRKGARGIPQVDEMQFSETCQTIQFVNDI